MKNYQNILFPYAYNVLGSSADAKDAIQDVLMKYSSMDIQPDSEKNYLIRGVINQSINLKRKKQKMQPADNWLPEPVSTETPDLGLELRELISYSMLVLLERLNPKERGVFILKEAFAYTHKEIADILSCSVENSRKLLSRARAKIQKESPHFNRPQKLTHYADKIDDYVRAIRNKDLERLQTLLSDDVTFYADGGDKINVVKQVCRGVQDVSGLLIYTWQKFHRTLSIRPAEINHQPALLLYSPHSLKVCQVYEFDEYNKIQQVYTILNPDKLKSIEENQEGLYKDA